MYVIFVEFEPEHDICHILAGDLHCILVPIDEGDPDEKDKIVRNNAGKALSLPAQVPGGAGDGGGRGRSGVLPGAGNDTPSANQTSTSSRRRHPSRNRRRPMMTPSATTTSTSSPWTRRTSPPSRQKLQDLPVDGGGGRAGRQAADLRHRRPGKTVPFRRAHLPHALRRGLVDGHTLARLPAGQPAQGRRAALQREIRALRNAL